VLPSATFGRLVDIRNDEVTVIACSETATARDLLQTLRKSGFAKRAGNGRSVRLGASADVLDIAGLPQAIEEARMAVEFANAARPLMHFSDIDLQEFVIRRSDGAAARLIPEWIRQLNVIEDDQSRELVRTIRTFADCSLNVKQTARRLDVHTNTVYFRLNRIGKFSGVNPRTYSGISTLLTAFRLLEVHGGGPTALVKRLGRRATCAD
jgi:carbohydrate diacid regulator